jgi:TolB-like protein
VPSSANRHNSVLRFDEFELDLRAGELRKRGVKLRLRGQPLQVLAKLLHRAGDLVTHEELRLEIWPADTFVDFNHSLHNAIARVRETLNDSSATPRYIETLPRVGYRFIGQVDEVQPAALSSTTRHVQESGARQIRSIAVLPLENYSSDLGNEYFADGMTEALITSLAKIRALRVISRTSAMQYRASRKSLPQIARELGVEAVIEGSVMRSGDRVRVAAQLIHAATDRHLWAESYERDFRDVLSLQSEIARQVADQIRLLLTPEEQAHLRVTRRVDPEAHELYLKARYFWNKRTEESVRKALSLFQRAIDCDPLGAHGYAGIADCYNILGYFNALAPMDAYPKARTAAFKALELDELMAEPHAALGVVKRDFEWDWRGAEAEFNRALELNPGCVEACHWGGTLQGMLGRGADAIREKKKALAMDPLSVVIKTDLGRTLYFSRDYDRAEAEFQSALEMDPRFEFAHLWLAHVYQQKGEFARAIEELQTGERLTPESTFAVARLGHGCALGGKHEEARVILERLKTTATQRYVSPYDIAIVYVGLREKDEAFVWLQKALQERSIWLGYIGVEPQLDELRSDQRFDGLIRAVGLPT